MSDSPSTLMLRRSREPRTRWLPAHQKRAGLGVWAAVKSWPARNAVNRWKRTHPFDPTELAGFAEAVANLVRVWSPLLPAGTVLRVPPQGASVPGPSAAEALGQAVAEVLGLPFVEVLTRSEPKRWPGPHASLRQAPFLTALPDPAPPRVLVAEDLVPSGATMRRSLEAIRPCGG
jgi:hypothetical protein